MRKAARLGMLAVIGGEWCDLGWAGVASHARLGRTWLLGGGMGKAARLGMLVKIEGERCDLGWARTAVFSMLRDGVWNSFGADPAATLAGEDGWLRFWDFGDLAADGAALLGERVRHA